MLNIYYSNQLASQKDLLVRILAEDANPDPFAQETILVQSLGMAQWLQMAIADHLGIAGNIQFPYPTSFVWQQYRTLFPSLPKENIFSRTHLLWRLMRLIPEYLENPDLSLLKDYLSEGDQLKCYQLAAKIADLFDQYLIYRPQWLIDWEQGNEQAILADIAKSLVFKQKKPEHLAQAVRWQGILWNALIKDIRQTTDAQLFDAAHRAYLQQRYFEKLDQLTESEKARLPKRIFVFGISSLPLSQLEMLKKLSQHCTVHLFFTNPSQAFWGDQQDDRILEKLALNQQLSFEEVQQYNQGNPLLAIWGKQGKEFFNLLEALEAENTVPLFEDFQHSDTLLAQLKQSILEFRPELDYRLNEQDRSVQIHACHSKMREVEVLHNQLLSWFEQDPNLSPKDIIVMSPDIDGYAPYIEAVFSRYSYQDPRYIPFTLSDRQISQIDPILGSFLSLIHFKEKVFGVDEIFELLNVEAIRAKYAITETELGTLKEWVINAGIRAGLKQDNDHWQNFNSWENGLNRLLLGTALKEENNPWQSILAFDESYGLSAEATGRFAFFIENLTAWQQTLSQTHTATEWQEKLLGLLEQFYCDENDLNGGILILRQTIESIVEQIYQSDFDLPLTIEVLAQQFEQQFSDYRSNLNFMVGKVNFCTLLPMRAIPFKIVCLLGMNEGEFPRQHSVNNFDLMQYAYRKGDRAKRDDDRYLFLEALLSAQQIFYLSYIGQSLTDNQEKLPSILVAQLKDYLKSEGVALPTYLHPMTVFSPKNFMNGAFSYDKEWLQAAQKRLDTLPFIQTLGEDLTYPTEIELDELIRFVQHPVKYFFQRHLGVYFERYDESVEQNEIFALSNLEKYHLRDQLVGVEQSKQAQFLTNAKLKGALPVRHFGELAEKDISEFADKFRTELAEYLYLPKDTLEIATSHVVSLNGKNYQVAVQGHIQNYFGKRAIIQWRTGGLKDRYLIKAWIQYLFLVLSGHSDLTFRFYFVEKDKVKALRFKAITSEQAEQMISRYLQDYFANFCCLTTALPEKLTGFFKDLEKQGEEELTSLAEKLEKLIEPNDNERPDIYLGRIPFEEFDLHDIQQRTKAWFELMMKSQEIE